MKQCCKIHAQLRQTWEAFYKTMYALIGGNPRHWLMIYDHLKQQGLSNTSLKIMLSKECPCKQETQQ